MGYAESKATDSRRKALQTPCPVRQSSASAYPTARHKSGYADLGIASALRAPYS